MGRAAAPLDHAACTVPDATMAGLRHNIIGVCRFSYPSLGGFAGPKLGIKEQQQRLFEPARLERRFQLFETLTLPSLAAQTDMDFVLVVLIGRDLPPRHKSRLRDLVARFPFVRLSQQEPAGPLVSTRKAFRRGLLPDASHVTGFRIDDDDAVGADYIANTRGVAEILLDRGWADADNPVVIAFHRGIYWDMNNPTEPFFEFREKTPLGLASAMLTVVDSPVNIFRWNHRHLPAHIRCWTDPTDIMFLRTLHGSNDSDRKIPPAALPLETDQALGMLSTQFGIDPEKALQLMARQ